MSEFEGRIAVVTGASQGIGREIAVDLARHGARVMALARNRSALEETASLAGDAAGAVTVTACDVTDAGQIKATAEAILGEHKKIDYLVNNAGVTRDGLLMRMTEEDWDTVVRTNLTAAYRMCRAFLPSMVRAREGRVVNISSVVGVAGNPGQTNYAASKAGLEGFTRSLAREIASRHVTVNAVAPGYIKTAMTDALPEKARQALVEQIPLRSLGTPADVSAGVRFLLGEGGRYITGQVLHINGGMYM